MGLPLQHELLAPIGRCFVPIGNIIQGNSVLSTIVGSIQVISKLETEKSKHTHTHTHHTHTHTHTDMHAVCVCPCVFRLAGKTKRRRFKRSSAKQQKHKM